MKLCKAVARPTLLYGSEIWVTTKRDITRLEAAEMAISKKCQKIHKTRQNKKRSHKKRTRDLWNKDVRAKYKQNWINHLERMDNNRIPKHALNYKPRGRRDRGRPRKRWQSVDAGTVQAT